MVGREQILRGGTAPLLRALGRLIGFGARQLQLSLSLEPRPRSAGELRRHLVRMGLSEEYICRLTRNRSVVVSFSGRDLRLHYGYLGAPDDVLRAIVAFVNARTRQDRSEARRKLLAFPLPEDPGRVRRARPRRGERSGLRTHCDDERFARALSEHHATLNAGKFGGELRSIPIRISRRMRSGLGHYTWRGLEGGGAEIVISRRHIRRHGWDEALHTLLHEMVHQWQDERGMPVDHGTEFRKKARAVGITPLARRNVA